MAQTNADVLSLQLEKVRDKIPLMYEQDDILLTMIQQRGDVETVSTRNMRIPLQLKPGGKAGAYDPDGGDLGVGRGEMRGGGRLHLCRRRGDPHAAGTAVNHGRHNIGSH